MPAIIRLEVHLRSENYNPDDIWHESRKLYTYLHRITASDLTKALETIEGGDLEDSQLESVWTFDDQDLSSLTDALEQMGITDVIPDIPDVEYMGYTVRILY